MDNAYSPVSIKESDSFEPSKKKISRSRWFHWQILPSIYINNTNSTQSLFETARRGNVFQFILWGQYYSTKSNADSAVHENDRPVSLMDINADMLNISKSTPATHKKNNMSK